MKRASLLLGIAFAGSAVGAAPDPSANVEEIIARHVEAKGGAEQWAEIENVRMRGEYTAFSKVSPFTLHKAPGGRYLLDTVMNERKYVVGHDGETAWWDTEFGDGGPQPIASPVELGALQREFDFSTPLMEYRQRGFTVERLADVDEIDGFPAIALQLTRDDESTETWYLDPDTYLELARQSPGSDFGDPVPSLTFFDDFREVGGVMIPHYVESQFYTRNRILQANEAAVNVELEEGFFSLPTATGMDPFQNLLGHWTVKVESKQSPRQPEFTESTRESTITASLNGGQVEERFTTDDGLQVVRTFSYDRYRDRYVMTQMNDRRTYLDIQTGSMADGRLVVSNVDSDTSFSVFGATVHERTTLEPTDDGFRIQRESSTDAGENWGVTEKATYTRKPM